MTVLELIICIVELLSLVNGQGSCEDGSCYPTIGDLLVGRSKQLSASSTCGQEEPERYCIISYLEDDQKCFICDSRNPYNQYYHTNSHQIENVISTFDPDWKKKWWQSENGVDLVSIRLDLETLFQFSHLVMTFKTFRPAAMLVERSRDFGKTWKVFRYFAQNCDLAFPHISEGHAEEIGDVVCDSRYSDMEPSSEGEVVLKALDPSFDIDDPYDAYIQDIITITNLRINFTKLHTFGDTLGNGWQSEQQEKYYYAIYEMIIRGNCFCNGHASQCIPVDSMRGDVFNEPGMVHGKCVCQHNTDGLNCEKCKEFYNDAPWSPAVGFENNACKKCNCNDHSDKCHYDMLVDQANNGASGGVCEDCQHNTKGNQCELCKQYFYHDPLKDISDPDTCIPCDCDPNGSKDNGICEAKTNHRLGIIAGTCVCKEHAEGMRCDQCKPGYFDLDGNNPEGCRYCGCNHFGTLPFSFCDVITGQCQCQSLVIGQHCDECIPGYWGLGNSLYPCSACNCDIGGARMSICSQSTGQCDCLPNIVGLECNEPANGYYIVPLDYYIYEAEKAQVLPGSGTIVNPTPMPKCKEYFLKQGIDFRFENDRIILKSMKKRSLRGRRQAQEILPYGTDGVVELVLRQPSPGKPITWTGPGFARVLNGAGLRFTVNNIPYSMDFIIAIRYEPESLEDWTARIIVNPPQGVVSEYCKTRITQPEGFTLSLAATSRLAMLNSSVCLDPNTEYHIDVYFSQTSNRNSNSKLYVLIDSLGLIPQIESVSNLCTELELQEYDYYNCIEIATDIGAQILPDVCEKLIFSMSARIHNGALKCTCNPHGSVSSICSKIGGQCQCKLNVVGSCCDRCAVGSYGFGPNGCQECNCDSKGSISTLCDQVTGQCACRGDIQGQRCDSCLPGYYGFPNCRPCRCNGNSETCDPVTGACKGCKGFTDGANCEQCIDNYYGNPLLGQPCRPCMCPGSPTSKKYFADSCQQNNKTMEVTCNCFEGYTGKNCNECPDGFYGNIEEGEECLPCQCNDNINVKDPNSCDKITGECLLCMKNTFGPNCESCLPGFFGSGLHHNCIKCNCDSKGSISTLCDQVTGQCPCRGDIQGQRCDSCLPGYYGFPNCQPCKCNGNSETCDPVTGACKGCKGFTDGTNCERCIDNYYGNPLLGQPCRPCMCPGSPTSKKYFADSCKQNNKTMEVTCNCLEGYTGKKCNECPDGFYGNIEEGEECLPCQCSDNINVKDPNSCDKITGECFLCMKNTYGPNCESCLSGFFGSGLHQNCTKCNCDSKGSISTLCDQVTGQCPCHGDIQGQRCDSCLPGYYGFPNCRPCKCNGNSETCDPVTGACKGCKRFTDGTNCERCIDNYYGNPLLGQPCRPCMCPGSPTSKKYFADSCKQDNKTMEVNCNCLEGYTGKNCNECPDGFYGNIEEGEECLPCQCNDINVKDPNLCDKITGECLLCMKNTYGPNCESCLPGFFGSGIHHNCTSCVCNPKGIHTENCSIYEEVGECVCDSKTGQCPCLPNVVGISCDTCAPGYWGFNSVKGCQPCNCFLNNSYGNQCNQSTGQCVCKPKYTGTKCKQCEENHFRNQEHQCIPCRCNLEGSQKNMCDKESGSCNCKPGVTGRNCDQCVSKFKLDFPACPQCHMCFDQYETQVSNLSTSVHAFVRLAAKIVPTRSPTGCDIQIRILQDKLSAIEKIFRSPILSPEKYNKVKKYYDTIRQKVNSIKIPDLGKFNEIAKMNKIISDLGKEIDNLFTELNKIKKKKEIENTIKVKDIQESLEKITKHYKTSLSAVEKARNAAPMINTATKTRKNILNALNNLDAKDKQNLDKLNTMKSLQISKMNEMVCGTVWDFPCDRAPCGGALCRDTFGNRKCGGPNCNGVMQVAKDALNKANETDTKLKRVAIQLLEAEEQIANMRQIAEDTKLKASRLNKTLSKTMSRIEADKNRSKELIKNVKDFLLDSVPVHQCREMSGGKTPAEVDGTVGAEEIEKIANAILDIKLPVAPYDLINMLNKIKKYCDDYKNNKIDLQNQLEEVKKLTQRAKDAKKAVENLPNGDEVRNNLKQAENAQKTTNTLLKNVNKDIQDIRDKLSQVQARADKVDSKLKSIKDMHSQLESRIAELQEKMLKNRIMADKAQEGANNALSEANESENDLNNLKEKYELLKEKLKNQDIPPEILERLQKLKKNAEDLVNVINEKFERISDLEDKIDDLNKANEEKANELLQLEKKAIELRDYILHEENKQANCRD
ncbi:laminin subunit beta-4 isoform X1 [Ranitomeya variabilis]|uniref:laminin subunit beta-4 isoform X1 n=1 Tax=Ranitomeya variabilis TaxID=490064 RepID=UPI004056FBDB